MRRVFLVAAAAAGAAAQSPGCIAELEKDCVGDQGKPAACAGCVTSHVAALRAAGCSVRLGTHDDTYDWCHAVAPAPPGPPAPTPPAPTPPGPAPGPMPLPKLPLFGPYSTNVEEFTVGGLKAGGSQLAVIAYPTDTSRTFPFLSFGHGATSGGKVLQPQYSDLLRHIASHGYIIVAPESCPQVCNNMADDLLGVIATCGADRSLHPALARATFDRVGIFGHSLGAVSSSKATVPTLATQYNVTANVGLHGCTAEAAVTLPTFFTTGTQDPFATPALMDNCVRGNPKATPRVYADINGGGHFEPGGVNTGPHRFDPYIARFFQCHVSQNSTACGDIYGDGPDALCNAYDYRTCEIVRPPPPATTAA